MSVARPLSIALLLCLSTIALVTPAEAQSPPCIAVGGSPAVQVTGCEVAVPVDDGCTLHVQRAGASGSDVLRYSQYSDSDGDGFTDVEELGGAGDSNPFTGCGEGDVGDIPLGDSDGDLLLDCQEDGGDGCGGLDTYETDPEDPDTDNDGSLDGIEALLGSDPTDPASTPGNAAGGLVESLLEPIQNIGADDADADGLADCQETGYRARGTSGNNPAQSFEAGSPYLTGENTTHVNAACAGDFYHTNPANPDSDADGISDGDEVLGRYASESCLVAPLFDVWTAVSVLREIPIVGGLALGLIGPILFDTACSPGATNPSAIDTDADLLEDSEEVGSGGSVVADGVYATSPTDPDSDADRVQDGTEVLLVLEPTDPTDSDSDDDGLDDCVEGGYVAYGTAPNNAASNLGVGKSGHDGSNATLSAARDCIDIEGAEPLTYFTSPHNADSDGDGIDDPTEVNGRDLTNPPNIFFDVLGGTVLEAGVKTNPSAADTDGDSWSDCDEIGFKANSEFDPYSTSGSGDYGDEGEAYSSTYDLTGELVMVTCAGSSPIPDPFMNYETGSPRQFWFTSPVEADSDDDGVSDRFEIDGANGRQNRGRSLYGNPTVADSDNDGLLDCQETQRFTIGRPLTDDLLVVGLEPADLLTTAGPLCSDLDVGGAVLGATYATAPRAKDSDDDGVKDGQELIDLTNPLNRHHLKGDGDGDADGMKDCQETGRGYGGINSNVVPLVVDFNDTVTVRVCTVATAAALDRYVTAPNDLDSDDDDVNDGEEILEAVAYGPATSHSNPTDSDTDDDGNFDCEEAGFVANSLALFGAADDPAGRCKDDTGSANGHQSEPERFTNPRLADSDADGISDGFEDDTHGTNPTFIDTDADLLSDCQERGRVPIVVSGQHPVVPPAIDPINAALTCPIHAGMADPGTVYLSDARFADSDRDQTSDGVEVMQGSNPTVPDRLADAACDMTDTADNATPTCQEFIDENFGPILESVRFPDPTMLFDEDCNFLDPLSWHFAAPGTGDEGEAVIQWKDGEGNWILWDGDGCNDQGVEASDIPSFDGAYDDSNVDVRDPLDIDEDGVVDESNGQPDAQETRFVVLDPHGALQVDPLGLSNGDEQGTVSADRNPKLNDTMGNGVTLYVRDPATARLRGTVTVIAGASPLVIVEAPSGSSFQTVCIDGAGLHGPFQGRYNGSCGDAATKDTDGDREPDAFENGRDAVLGGDSADDPEQNTTSAIGAIADGLLSVPPILTGFVCDEFGIGCPENPLPDVCGFNDSLPSCDGFEDPFEPCSQPRTTQVRICRNRGDEGGAVTKMAGDDSLELQVGNFRVVRL